MACYRELGAELRRHREAAGISEVELSESIGWSQTKISRIELGYAKLSGYEVILYLAFCGVHGPGAVEAREICRIAERQLGYWLSPHGEWLEDSLSSLIYHESTADRCTSYEPLLIPGLLQTAAYARVRIGAEQWRGPQLVDQCVRFRMERQQILHVPRPARFTYFLHEQVLHLQVGSPAIMHEQLLKLVLMASLAHVSVRVVPMSAAERSVLGGAFLLLEYAEHRPVVFLDNHSTGLFLEDPDYVAPFYNLVPAIAEVALDEGQSRELIASVADQYDIGSGRDADDRVEEEQP